MSSNFQEKMAEEKYKKIFKDFLTNKIDVEKFIEVFMSQWKRDRDDNEFCDDKFQRLINRIFTSCDCYSKEPKESFEINEMQLKDEIGLLSHIWFG